MILASLLLSIAAPLEPEAKQPSPFPYFEFNGLAAGADLPPGIATKCKLQSDGSHMCKRINDKVAGNYAQVSVIEYNNKLSSLFVFQDPRFYTDLEAALHAKYGDTCKSYTENWQNASGVHLDNPVEEWCFRSGKLNLKRFGIYSDEVMLEYEDDNQPPKVAGKVDF